MATEENLAHGHSFSPNAVEILFETLAQENGCIVVDLPRALYSVREQVLREATRKLTSLEQGVVDPHQGDLFRQPSTPVPDSALQDRLEEIAVDDLTPRQALELLYELKNLSEGQQ